MKGAAFTFSIAFDEMNSRTAQWYFSVERGGQEWFFALNMEGEQVWEQWGKPAARLALVRNLLTDLNVLQPGGRAE